jgi:hypothetical protein
LHAVFSYLRARLPCGRGPDRRVAGALQGFNALIRTVEVSRRDELEELAREVEELKRGYGGAA